MNNTPKKTGISLLSMIFLCLNGIVGSGLFLLPGQVAQLVGNWGLVVYLMVALIVLSIGWCYAQCASNFTKNGGAYLYAKEAFGTFVGFEIGIMRWFVGMIAWAALTAGFLVALGSVYPVVLLAPYKQIIIVGVIAALSVMNSFGARIVNKLSNIITVTKGLLLLFFILFGIFAMDFSELSFNPMHFPTAASLGLSAFIIFFAFSGFEALPVVAQETDNPRKNIPIAMMTAIVFSSILYFVVQSICIGTLGDALKQSTSPIGDIAELLGGNLGKFLVSCAMLISIGGVIIVSSFVTPRSFSALAADHVLFSKANRENRFGAPWVAIAVSGLISCVIALTGSFVELVVISAVSRFSQHITTCAALFVMNKRGLMNSFSSPWKKAIPCFALASMAWLLSYAEIYQLLYGFAALFLGIPLYYIQTKIAQRSKALESVYIQNNQVIT